MKAAKARAVLTGATGGIGQAASEALLLAGTAVMLVGRSPDRLAAQAHALVQRLQVKPERVGWHAADLNHASHLAAMAAAAAAWDANVLVHSAGLASFGRLETLDAAEMQQVLQTNLLAPMLLTQLMLPHLRTAGPAQVICVGSALGRLGLPGYSVYSASKFGLRGFAEALRRELADTRVRVQYLGPRATQTEFNSSAVVAYHRRTGTAVDKPTVVAQALVQMLEDETPERFIGFPEQLAVRLNGLAPTLFDRSFAKHRLALPPLTAASDGAGAAGNMPGDAMSLKNAL